MLTDYIKTLCNMTVNRIMWLLDLEQRPSTLNEHYYASYRDKFLAFYRAYREKDTNGSLIDKLKGYKPFVPSNSVVRGRTIPTTPSELQDSLSKVFSGLAEVGITGVDATDLAKLLQTDPYEPALNIMATVRAYFQGECAICS